MDICSSVNSQANKDSNFSVIHGVRPQNATARVGSCCVSFHFKTDLFLSTLSLCSLLLAFYRPRGVVEVSGEPGVQCKRLIDFILTSSVPHPCMLYGYNTLTYKRLPGITI